MEIMINYKKYTDLELNRWEKEIFGPNLDNGKKFKDYLIERGAWIINAKYKLGAVSKINKSKYEMLIEKWSCLQFLRNRRSKAKKYQQKTLEGIGKINIDKIPF